MNATDRLRLEPAWVLHCRDFRDSSQIVDVFSREHGRVAMVARGVKRPKSRYRGLLQPFSPLLLSWVNGRELATMTDAEPGEGQPLKLLGDHMLAGFYINELVLKLTHRHDPQTQIFDLYHHTLHRLAASASLAATLRQFEINFLTLLGFGLNLEIEAQTGERVQADQHYHYIVDQGPLRTEDSAPGQLLVRGEQLQNMAKEDFSDEQTRKIARVIFASAIDVHLDGKTLKTRKVLRDLRKHARVGRLVEKSEANDNLQ